MPQIASYENLPGVADEVTSIINVLPESMSTHILVTPTKAEVEALLPKCQIVHLSCHGEASPIIPGLISTFKLRLEDGGHDDFVVADVLQLHLDHPHLAYLSACQTAATRDTKVLDEAIHLAGAFQFAGFPYVIATL